MNKPGIKGQDGFFKRFEEFMSYERDHFEMHELMASLGYAIGCHIRDNEHGLTQAGLMVILKEAIESAYEDDKIDP